MPIILDKLREVVEEAELKPGEIDKAIRDRTVLGESRAYVYKVVSQAQRQAILKAMEEQ